MAEPSSQRVAAGTVSAHETRRPALLPLVLIDLLLLDPVARLGLRGGHGLGGGLTATQWAVFAVVFAAFVFGEGWLALHQRFSVHVLARLRALDGEPLIWRLLGPLYAASLVKDSPRTLVRAWLGAAAIGVAVRLVKELAEPYRSMIDVSVAAALLLGIVSITGRFCVARTRN